jgi:hypothetical protein
MPILRAFALADRATNPADAERRSNAARGKLVLSEVSDATCPLDSILKEIFGRKNPVGCGCHYGRDASRHAFLYLISVITTGGEMKPLPVPAAVILWAVPIFICAMLSF